MNYGPDTILDYKHLIGYTQEEFRAINIKDNVHAGEWDIDILADWTADLNVDYNNLLRLFGLEDSNVLIAKRRKIKARTV